ncbi:BT4734/BF3469 family protein [Parabacteroides sp.]
MSFGISNNVKSRVVQVCTPELFDQAIRYPWVGRICAEIEDALEKARRGEMSKEDFDTFKAERKKTLPVITPHATFKNGRRLNADAVPSGLSMYDIDHIADPRGYFARKVEGRAAELGIVLAHVTPSSEGLRFFFVIPEGMDLPGAQKWMSGRLGDENYDGAVKDLARCSFVVPEDYILYLDREKLFADRPLKGAAKEQEPPLPCRPLQETEKEEEPMKFKGISYADIIAEWFAIMGGEPVQGERNTKLHKLACHLRYITDNDERLLLKVMPRFDLPEEEMRGVIHSACASKFCSDMPKVLKDAIRCAEKREKAEADPFEEGQGEGRRLPPPMPEKLPPLVKLLLSGTPDLYKPAVAHAIFPPLAAHLWRVRFRYIDNVEHEATLMNVLMAGTGAGKDCISEPINRIMADIRRRDEENLRREREWKDEVNSKGANKDKRKRPEGLVIQEIDADMTNPAFVMRTAEAAGHFLYTKMNEIDQFDALRGTGRGGQQFQIMCLAFDPGNRYGQTRVGTQSITEKVTIRFNWNAATTVQKGKRYFSRVLTDGPVSRINFCTIPEREIGADMPVYGSYDAAFDESIRPYIENLTRATGLVDCPGAFRLAEKLKEENAEEARLTQSRVFENLSFRAGVIAYLKACVLYVAHGCRWDKTIEDFIRWSMEYDMWCKMEFFGADTETAMRDTREGETLKRGRRNLLEMLPDPFTIADAIRIRQSQGMDAGGTRNMLNQWRCRHYITIMTNDNYQKLKYK